MPEEDESELEDDDIAEEITYTSVRVPTNYRRILNVMAEDLEVDVGSVIYAMLFTASDATEKETDRVLEEAKPKTRDILDVWDRFLRKWNKIFEEETED